MRHSSVRLIFNPQVVWTLHKAQQVYYQIKKRKNIKENPHPTDVMVQGYAQHPYVVRVCVRNGHLNLIQAHFKCLVRVRKKPKRIRLYAAFTSEMFRRCPSVRVDETLHRSRTVYCGDSTVMNNKYAACLHAIYMHILVNSTRGLSWICEKEILSL